MSDQIKNRSRRRVQIVLETVYRLYVYKSFVHNLSTFQPTDQPTNFMYKLFRVDINMSSTPVFPSILLVPPPTTFPDLTPSPSPCPSSSPELTPTIYLNYFGPFTTVSFPLSRHGLRLGTKGLPRLTLRESVLSLCAWVHNHEV